MDYCHSKLTAFPDASSILSHFFFRLLFKKVKFQPPTPLHTVVLVYSFFYSMNIIFINHIKETKNMSSLWISVKACYSLKTFITFFFMMQTVSPTLVGTAHFHNYGELNRERLKKKK